MESKVVRIRKDLIEKLKSIDDDINTAIKILLKGSKLSTDDYEQIERIIRKCFEDMKSY